MTLMFNNVFMVDTCYAYATLNGPRYTLCNLPFPRFLYCFRSKLDQFGDQNEIGGAFFRRRIVCFTRCDSMQQSDIS
jgi:hypothetical protein